MLFVRNNEQVRQFFAMLLEQGPGFYPWYQQGAMNDLLALDRWGGLCSRLDDRWNATWGTNECDHPVVVAWHNGQPPEGKLKSMQSFGEEALDGWV